MLYFAIYYIELIIILIRLNDWAPTWNTNLQILYLLLAIPLALSRFKEPYVYQTFIDTVSSKKIETKKKVQYADESLVSFLNSAMNIEFVYLILLGINKFN